MADHVAEQIVAAAKTALTGLTTTASRVFDSRVYPVQDADLPCLKIDQGDDEAEITTMHAPPHLERTLELLVIACVKQNTSYRTLVNTIRKEVETVFGTNQTLGGLCHWIEPRRCEIELSGEGEKPVAEATITLSVRYYTALNAPDVPL